MANPAGVEVTGPMHARYDEILTPEALELPRRAAPRLRRPPPRAARPARSGARAELADGGLLDFLPETREIREPATGGSPSRRPAWSTAGWRSPARPTRR